MVCTCSQGHATPRSDQLHSKPEDVMRILGSPPPPHSAFSLFCQPGEQRARAGIHAAQPQHCLSVPFVTIFGSLWFPRLRTWGFLGVRVRGLSWQSPSLRWSGIREGRLVHEAIYSSDFQSSYSGLKQFVWINIQHSRQNIS